MCEQLYSPQVHTTGIDIKHTIDAKCLVTIGKGMILRDLMQGAWRMRGIAKGQTIVYHTIAEIAQLIKRELSVATGAESPLMLGMISRAPSAAHLPSISRASSSRITLISNNAAEEIRDVSQENSSSIENIPNPTPIEIIKWLIENQIKVEKMQQLLLSSTCVSNVWRRQALEHLLEVSRGRRAEDGSFAVEDVALDEFGVHPTVEVAGSDPFFRSLFISKQAIIKLINEHEEEQAKLKAVAAAAAMVSATPVALTSNAADAGENHEVAVADVVASTDNAVGEKTPDTPSAEAPVESEFTKSSKIIAEFLSLPNSTESVARVESWLTKNIEVLQVTAKPLSKTNASSSKEEEKPVPAIFKTFELFDSEAPINSVRNVLLNLRKEQPGLLISAGNRENFHPAAFREYLTNYFREECLDERLRVKAIYKNKPPPQKKFLQYYDLLSSLSEFVRDWSSQFVVTISKNKARSLFTLKMQNIFGKPAAELKALVEKVDSTVEIELKPLELLNENICEENTEAIAVFKETVLYPAGNGDTMALADRLEKARDTRLKLFDKRSYQYSLSREGKANVDDEWNALDEVNYYIKKIRGTGSSDQSAPGGLESEQVLNNCSLS